MRCGACNSPQSVEANLKLYDFLSTEAYKFGFIVSYPKGRESETGYQFEPWHIRFIGEDLAKEIVENGYPDKGPTLNEFLEEKGKY